MAAVVVLEDPLGVAEGVRAVPGGPGGGQVAPIAGDRELVVHGDAGIGGDRPPVREGDLAAVVVDRVVGALPARHAHPVHRHPLAAGHHRDAGDVVAVGEQVRTLASFDAEDLQPVVLALGVGGRHHRPRCAHPALGAHTLEPALEARELPAPELERDVSERGGALGRAELDQYAVEGLEALGGAARAQRNVAVREHAGELDARPERAVHREVQRLADEGVLVGSELDREALVPAHHQRGAAGRRADAACRRRTQACDRAVRARGVADGRDGGAPVVVGELERRRGDQPAGLDPERVPGQRVAQQQQLAPGRVEHVVEVAAQRDASEGHRVAAGAQEPARQPVEDHARLHRHREPPAARIVHRARDRRRARQRRQRQPQARGPESSLVPHVLTSAPALRPPRPGPTGSASRCRPPPRPPAAFHRARR